MDALDHLIRSEKKFLARPGPINRAVVAYSKHHVFRRQTKPPDALHDL
jgi:hypothetical protein